MSTCGVCLGDFDPVAEGDYQSWAHRACWDAERIESLEHLEDEDKDLKYHLLQEEEMNGELRREIEDLKLDLKEALALASRHWLWPLLHDN